MVITVIKCLLVSTQFGIRRNCTYRSRLAYESTIRVFHCRRGDKKAAIGYVYEDSTPAPKKSETDLENEEEEEESSDEEVDLGVYFSYIELSS